MTDEDVFYFSGAAINKFCRIIGGHEERYPKCLVLSLALATYQSTYLINYHIKTGTFSPIILTSRRRGPPPLSGQLYKKLFFKTDLFRDNSLISIRIQKNNIPFI